MNPDKQLAPAYEPQPGLRPAPGRVTPLPEWVSTTDRNALPEVLDWANEVPRPPINGRVDVISQGIALGTGTVTGYFHRNGELGLWVELDSVPAFLNLPMGTHRTFYYGEDIRRLDQDDAPADAPPAREAAGVADVFAMPSRTENPAPPAAQPQPLLVASEEEDYHLTEDHDTPFA